MGFPSLGGSMMGLWDGGGGGGGFGLGGIFDILQSRPFGMFAGAAMSRQEQEEWNQYLAQLEGTAEEAEAKRGLAWGGGPMGRRPRQLGDVPRRGRAGIGGGYLGAVGRVSERGLAEAEEFYGAAPERFRGFARQTELGLQNLETRAGRYYTGLERGYEGLEAEGRAGAAGLVSRQEARERRLMGMQEGMGEQERRDIQQAYSGELSREQARLGALGLMGTGAARGAAMGVARERTGALGRMEERLRGERVGLSERLSGQTMQARAGALELGLGLGEQTMGAREATMQGMLGLEEQRRGTMARFGAAGLEYEEAAWGNLMGARERYGMMPAEAGLAEYESWMEQEFDRIQRLPPYGGQGAGLWGAAGQGY